MSSLLTDWCSFCEGTANFDKSHFLGLLKVHGSDDDFRKIFQYFSGSDEMAERARSVISTGKAEPFVYLIPDCRAEKKELLELAFEWLKEQERVCRLLNDFELLDICKSANLVFVSGQELEVCLQQDIPHYWFFESVGDAIRQSKFSESDQVYALLEALYGLAGDYYLAWYIGQSLFRFEIDLQPYFSFWKAGGRCALTEKSLLVTNQR